MQYEPTNITYLLELMTNKCSCCLFCEWRAGVLTNQRSQCDRYDSHTVPGAMCQNRTNCRFFKQNRPNRMCSCKDVLYEQRCFNQAKQVLVCFLYMLDSHAPALAASASADNMYLRFLGDGVKSMDASDNDISALRLSALLPQQ